MTKTRLDVVERALRSLGVLSADDTADAAQIADVGGVLDSLFEELQTVDGMVFSWALDATPDAAFIPLANLLAVEIAPDYEIAPRYTRERAMMRLRAYAFPNDLPDQRDLDDSGTVSDAEAQAGKEAAYY